MNSNVAHEERAVLNEQKRFTLRMDSLLFEEISGIAKMHKRSVAKEIECAIENYIACIAKNELSDRNN